MMRANKLPNELSRVLFVVCSSVDLRASLREHAALDLLHSCFGRLWQVVATVFHHLRGWTPVTCHLKCRGGPWSGVAEPYHEAGVFVMSSL